MKWVGEGGAHASRQPCSTGELLDKIRAAHPVTPITLILDNARHQHCKVVAMHAAQADMELPCLPAYSPNLSLIERLRKLTRKKGLTNRRCPAFAEFRAGIDDRLRKMSRAHLPELRSLLTLNFQLFPSHKSS